MANEYSQGVCHDGAAILKNGQPMRIEEILAELRAAQSCTAEPVAIEYQHEETGQIGYIDVQQVEWGFFENNPRLQEIGPLYRHPPPQPAKARVPDEAFNIIEGIRAELTWSGWRRTSSRGWVMHSLSELLSMLTASPAPGHIADVRKMVAPDVSELVKAAQTLWRESYSCESAFIQAVVDAFSKQEEAER